MDKYIKVAATTTGMNLEDIREALENRIGRKLYACKGTGVSRNTVILTTGDQSSRFFCEVKVSDTTLYAEDNRFSSYEECVSHKETECAIVENLARELGGFNVKIECFGECLPPKDAVGGVIYYSTCPKKQEESMLRVSATTAGMSLEDIKNALEGYVGEPLSFCKWNIGLPDSSSPCITTKTHYYEFFYEVNDDGSVTLFDEDDRFESYEECRNFRQGTTGCAIVERLAGDVGGFEVKIECFGKCAPPKEATGGVLKYSVPSKEREIEEAIER